MFLHFMPRRTFIAGIISEGTNIVGYNSENVPPLNDAQPISIVHCKLESFVQGPHIFPYCTQPIGSFLRNWTVMSYICVHWKTNHKVFQELSVLIVEFTKPAGNHLPRMPRKIHGNVI